MDTIIKLSASKIKMFFQCRKLFHAVYEDRQDQIQNSSAILGAALHKAIELYYKERRDPVQTYYETFDRMLAEAGSNIKVFGNIASIRSSGIEILGKFDWNSIRPKDSEVHFELPFPNAENPLCIIRGVIDAPTEDSYVIDYKSGSKLPDAETLANDVQFVIYYWAYEQLYGEKPKGVMWYHLRTGTLHNTHVHKYINRKLSKLAKDIKQIIEATSFEKKTSRDPFCKNICGLDTECWGVT